jgi:GT2 family glycosyltransferase
MSPSPLVSVVISVYNGERYLRGALESVLGQEGVDLEVVLVDDGSTDASAEIAAVVARRDSRLRLFRQENAGLTQALALGCGEARGVFIARQDDDDLSGPGRLEKLAAVLEADARVAVAASWVDVIGPKGEFLHRTEYPQGLEGGTEAVVERGRNPVHGTTMFRKADYEAVGGYRPEFYFAQDADLWLRLVERGGFLFVPEVLYSFRVQDGSISTHHREAQGRLHALARHCRKARAAGGAEEPFLLAASEIRPVRGVSARAGRGAASYFIGRTLYGNRDPRAIEYLRSYVRQRPFSARGWASLALAAATLRGAERP